MTKNAILDINGLVVNYAVQEGLLSAVSGVDLKISEGEIYALVGESGCGKSTIAYSVMGLLDRERALLSGSICYKGQELVEAPRGVLRDIRGKEIGMIFQNPMDSLDPVYRAGTQVEEALLLDKTDRVSAWKRVLELFRDVRIPDEEKRTKSFPHELSGGMRQRVMIAMMLARRPNLLICDEPTTALDVTVEAEILDIIKGLREEHGTSFLLITHNFGIVAEIADRIGIMYAGELVEEGDVFTIFDHACHPYTRGLLKSLPRIFKREGMLATIEGTVPRIMEGTPGCRFANRCAFCEARCQQETPARVIAGEGHTVLCHRWEEFI
ncbi:MAG: ABC transporter ATP-binding protein [Clostridia bacterium]|nr:ABC transporter ATP-binding protein [Clostridia bacterium]